MGVVMHRHIIHELTVNATTILPFTSKRNMPSSQVLPRSLFLLLFLCRWCSQAGAHNTHPYVNPQKLQTPWATNRTLLRGESENRRRLVTVRFTQVPFIASYFRSSTVQWSISDCCADKLKLWRRVDTDRSDDGSGYNWSDWTFLSYLPLTDTLASLEIAPDCTGWPFIDRKGTIQLKIEATTSDETTILSEDISDTILLECCRVVLSNPVGGVALIRRRTYEIEWKLYRTDPVLPIPNIMWYQVHYAVNGLAWESITGYHDDMSYAWTVPNYINEFGDQLEIRIRTLAQRSITDPPFLWDSSVSRCDNSIIAYDTPAVSLLSPNPPSIEGLLVLLSDDEYTIQYEATFVVEKVWVYFSPFSDASWSEIAYHEGANIGTSVSWTVPFVETREGRVKIVGQSNYWGSTWTVESISCHPFTVVPGNEAPVADAGPDKTGREGEVVLLDGRGSFDFESDPISYVWKLVDPWLPPQPPLVITLRDTRMAVARFQADGIILYPKEFVFELEVFDWIPRPALNRDRVTITVLPKPPVFTSFEPKVGWEGTEITVRGLDLRGVEVLIESTVLGKVSGENEHTFTLPAGLPFGHRVVHMQIPSHEDSPPIPVTSPSDTIEIFPAPYFQYQNGFGFSNFGVSDLSYPWNFLPGNTGNYKDTFGTSIYISIRACIGLLVWSPWTGWKCVGVKVDTPIAPDPLAVIYYYLAFKGVAAGGMCVGFSMMSLRFQHGDDSIEKYDPLFTTPGEMVTPRGGVQRWIEMRQGSQLSAEVLLSFAANFVGNLVPSSSVTGLGRWLEGIKTSISSGKYGILTFEPPGHAVIPYYVVETDSEARIYVYDPNRPDFSTPEAANTAARTESNPYNHPPYIHVDKSGIYWDWSYEWSSTTTYSGQILVSFIDYDTWNGDRTIPTNPLDLIIMIFSAAEPMVIENSSGKRVGSDSNGTMFLEIDGAAPLPNFQGAERSESGWYFPASNKMSDNYTITLHAEISNDQYDWGMVNGRCSMHINATSLSDEDTIMVDFADGNPLAARMEYKTVEQKKLYKCAIVHKYEQDDGSYIARIFSVETELTNTGTHKITTNEDDTGVMFTNEASLPCILALELSTNTATEDSYHGLSKLPTLRKEGITVQQGETVEMKVDSGSWTTLDRSSITVTSDATSSPTTTSPPTTSPPTTVTSDASNSLTTTSPPTTSPPTTVTSDATTSPTSTSPPPNSPPTTPSPPNSPPTQIKNKCVVPIFGRLPLIGWIFNILFGWLFCST